MPPKTWLLVATSVALVALAAPTTADALHACTQADGAAALDLHATSEATLDGVDDGSRHPVPDGSGTDAGVAANTTHRHGAGVVGGASCDAVDATGDGAAGNATDGGNGHSGDGDASTRGDRDADGADGSGWARSRASGSAHGSGDAAANATVGACATIEARALGGGSIRLVTNTSQAVDGVVVERTSSQGTHAFSPAGDVHVDTGTRAGVAYTYRVAVVVDGQRSAWCDSVEVTSVPVLPGAAAGVVLATAATLAYAVCRR